MESTPAARLSRALDSLEGLSVGDAFGEGFFPSRGMVALLLDSSEFDDAPYSELNELFIRRELIDIRRTAFIPKPWKWTDDTALALEIVAHLRDYRRVEAQMLARGFAYRYRIDPRRGYGGAMHSLLPDLALGDWEMLAPALFNGTGSYGNGSAMRVAPLGAYFADDPQLCAREAALSSRITHSHPEGVAGGIATAMAACFAARARELGNSGEEIDLIGEVMPFVPDSEVKKRLEQARRMNNATGEQVADFLGAGHEVSAYDTVPFCLWCASQSLEYYEEALWETVSGLGDRDTTCAIVGGIVASFTGAEGIPAEWRESREELGEF